MIIDQLFEDDDKKKKLNEIDPRNYDSDEDYYNDLHGDDDDEDFDGDAADDEVADMDNDEESYYEKYVRTKNLEEEMPVIGQSTGTTSQTDTPPRRSFAVKIMADFYDKKPTPKAQEVWQALETVLPRDYPRVPFQQATGNEPQSRVMADIRDDKFSIVKQNISSEDIAETIASKFEGKGIPAEVIHGGVYEEAMGRKTDAKGRTQQQWIQAVYKKFPDARIVQAKMIDGPAHAMLPDGRKFSWTPVQGMAEAKVSTAAFRASNAKRAKLNAMSPEERKEYDKEQAEKQRKRDDARLEKERQKLAAKKGIDEDLNRRGFLQGLGMAAAGAAGLGAAGAAQARATPDWMEKVKRAKALMAKGQSREQTARIMGIKGPNPGGAGPMSGDWGAVNYAAQEMRVKESTTPKQRRLNEAMLMEDPIYRKFKQVGRYIAERKMTEKEILDVFAQAEQGMTNADTGANRTMLGRGKDTATKFAGNVSGAVKGVLDSMRTSVPVQAVEVAYDQATDALADVTGGQDGPVMNVLKQYRMLAKEYPKTTGLVRSALIMAAGMATGGAAPIAIIGALGALDRALKGNTLFNSLTGGAADSALAGVSQAVAGAMGSGADAASAAPGSSDFQLPADSVAANAQVDLDAAREWINADEATRAEIEQITGMSAAQLQDIAVSNDLISNADSLAPGEEIVPPGGSTAAVPGAEGFGGGTYTTMPGDQGGYIAQSMGIPFKELEGLNPQITNWNKLPVGTELQLPPTGDNVGSVWRDLSAGPGATTAAPGAETVPTAPATATTAPTAPATTAAPSSPYGAVRGPMGLSYTTVANMPVIPGQPLNPTQMAVADFAVQQGNQLSPVVQAAYDLAKRGAVRESIKFKKLSFDKLVDQKSTVMNWALSESVGRKSHSVNLTTVGTYTVFENVDRYRKALLEYVETQPGRPQLPDLYRPDMPDAPMQPADPAKKSWLGRGLDALDRGVKKVGGALSNFGHQFTTNVTKEKLKMNWHQAGKPSDSDQLAAWLVKQGVPQDVVTTVYGKMGIPYTAPGTPAPAPTTPAAAPAATGGAQKQMAFYGTNPKTGKPWTYDELQAKATAGAPVPTGATAKPAATSPTGFNAGNVMKLPGMEKYATKPAPAKAPNFAQQGGGYAKVNQPTTVSYSGMLGTKPATAPAATAPVSGPMKIGGQTLNPKNPADKKIIDQVQAQTAKVAEALKRPVAEMLSMVETKEDVAKIKQFVDQTFVKYGAVSESAFVVRNKLIEHITQVGAQRRREFARKS